MSITLEIKETSARTSKKRMDELGLSVTQVLASMGTTIIDGEEFRITKLIDVDTGLEIS